jgi:hypothetical protein
MQLQAELAQPLPEYRQHSLCIGFVSKEHHKVIAEANQGTRAA